MESHTGERPDKVTSYFYLQQINQSTVVVMGDMEVKKPIGPLMVRNTLIRKYLNYFLSKNCPKWVHPNNF